jgi:hypothetical protein
MIHPNLLVMIGTIAIIAGFMALMDFIQSRKGRNNK